MSSQGDAQRRAKRQLEAEGYVVDNRPKAWNRLVTRNGRTFRVGGAQDTLGCIDLQGFHPDRPIKAVQATTRGAASHRKRKVESGLAGVYLPGRPIESHMEVEVWSWGRRAGARRGAFKVERYLGGSGRDAWRTERDG